MYMRKWVGRVMNNGVYLDKSSGKPLGFQTIFIFFNPGLGYRILKGILTFLSKDGHLLVNHKGKRLLQHMSYTDIFIRPPKHLAIGIIAGLANKNLNRSTTHSSLFSSSQISPNFVTLRYTNEWAALCFGHNIKL